MRATRSRTVSTGRLLCLLGFLLLLPMAQLAAARHALWHAGADANAAPGAKQALNAGHCDLCLIAAAVGGGAPPVAAPSFAPATIRHEPPRIAAASVWTAAPARAYRSRAPPLAPR